MKCRLTTDALMPPVREVQQLRRMFVRLERIDIKNATTINNLKRVWQLRIAEIESALDPQAPEYLR